MVRVILAFSGFLVLATGQQLQSCPSDWQYSKMLNSCYKVVTQAGGVNYDDGTALCKAAGGQLTSIHSKEEDMLVQDLSDAPNSNTRLQALTGGQRTNGVWAWSDGTPFDYKNFAKTDDAKQCLQLWSTNSTAINPNTEFGLWDDAACTNKYTNAVCKIVLAPKPTCPADWTFVESLNNCYKVVKPATGGLNFDEANAMCQKAGGQLASIHSAEENAVLIGLSAGVPASTMNTRYQTLIGGKRANGVWSWSDGTPVDYKYFANTDDAKPCLQLWSTNSLAIDPIKEYKQWDDIPCTAKFYNAVCKITLGGGEEPCTA